MKSWTLHAHVRFLLTRNQSTLTNHLPSVDLFIPPPVSLVGNLTHGAHVALQVGDKRDCGVL